MAQGSPQFTPRQLLDAGRRAEAEGKLDQANQLYRHLTDHYAYTIEAAEARNGLGRIGIGAASSCGPKTAQRRPRPSPTTGCRAPISAPEAGRWQQSATIGPGACWQRW